MGQWGKRTPKQKGESSLGEIRGGQERAEIAEPVSGVQAWGRRKGVELTVS